MQALAYTFLWNGSRNAPMLIETTWPTSTTLFLPAWAQAAGPVLPEELSQRGVKDRLVIDLGCGSGILSRVMSEAGGDVLGIDISGSRDASL